MRSVLSMQRYLPVLVLTLSLGAFGCNRNKSAVQPSSAPMVEVIHGDNFTVTSRYEYHVGVPFEELVKKLPAGSVDAILLDMTFPSPTQVVQTVTIEPSVPTGPRKFTTKFKLSSGEEVSKEWEAASSNTSGTFRAVFTVPQGTRHIGTSWSS